jgi:STE24 endopeptidase
MGNAAVMGVLPGLRYILLSDLLLETMTDAQIEAVFAHELGHIVYRHMIWYVVFISILMLATLGPGQLAYDLLERIVMPRGAAAGHYAAALNFVLCSLGATLFFVLFGCLSRRFERQADVFAARTMEQEKLEQSHPHTPPLTARPPVGPYGASLFASALERVAVVNNIPATARSWCHGSIAKRMTYLHDLSTDAMHTRRFDRVMGRIYVLLIGSLFGCAAWLITVWATHTDAASSLL